MVITIQKENIATTVANVSEVFEKYVVRAPDSIDQYNAKGKAVLEQKITKALLEEKPISFVMPGFPAKSPNIETKVLGYLPDGAEHVAFQQFSKFVNEMENTYAPGIELNIVSDGYVFNDILNLPDSNVKAYEEMCKEMVQELPINIHTIFDFYKEMSKQNIIEDILLKFGETEEVLADRIKNDQDTTLLYNGLSIFMQQDLVWEPEISKSQIKKSAKKLAKEMMRRSEAYTGLINAEFSNSIRISCHPSINDGRKFSWRFVDGINVSASPWHNTLCVYKDGSMTYKKKHLAEEEGLEIVMKGNRPYYFQEKGTTIELFN